MLHSKRAVLQLERQRKQKMWWLNMKPLRGPLQGSVASDHSSGIRTPLTVSWRDRQT